MINIIIGLLSLIPYIDINFTKLIYNFPTKKFSKFFSIFIIYFNILVNFILLWFIPFKIIKLRYFIELFIVDIIFKHIIDRKRPKDSLFKNNCYFGFTNFTFTKNLFNIWKNTDSFPSGHVTTVYCTWILLSDFFESLILNYFYVIIISLTFYSRINIGAHYLSDCVWAIIISNYCYSLLK